MKDWTKIRPSKPFDLHISEVFIKIGLIGNSEILLNFSVTLNDVQINPGKEALRAFEDIVSFLNKTLYRFSRHRTRCINSNYKFFDTLDFFVLQRFNQRHIMV